MTTTNLLFMGDELKKIAEVTLRKRKFHVPLSLIHIFRAHETLENLGWRLLRV